jgi:hypothetical protein
MIVARLFSIACGCEDWGDIDLLRFDSAFKLACGRLSESDHDLMSQPTLSRLENAPLWRDLMRMGLSLIDLFCDSFGRVPERIVLDINDTDDAVHPTRLKAGCGRARSSSGSKRPRKGPTSALSSPTYRAEPCGFTRGPIAPAAGWKTSLLGMQPCPAGQRIKEDKFYTKSDRTSCHRWQANQFRLFLHISAYWLLHQLRRATPRRLLRRNTTLETFRRAFLKIAVRNKELKPRVAIELRFA